jgi:hypothetical protein
VPGVNDVRQMHTVEPLVLIPEAICIKVEIDTGNLKRYKSSGINQIPAELIQAGGNLYVL